MLLPFKKKANRILSILVFGLMVIGIVSLHGDLDPVVAQGVPHIDQVIGQLEAHPGFFNTYTTPDGLMAMEITEDHFEKDFLMVVQMDRGVGESFLLTGYPLDSDMLTFRMRNQKIELVHRNPNFRADEGTPHARMIDLGFRESVKAAFPIIARDDETKRYLIETTNWFINDWANLRLFLPAVYGVGFGFDRSRSTLTSVKGFPKNVEVKVDLTFATALPIPSLAIPDEYTMPVAIHYSLLELPEVPMQPRLADDRVGYFTSAFRDFSKEGGPTDAVHIAQRWRLEKKQPFAPLSEPIKPITYYLENTIPEQWRPYIKEGVESWNKAFEAAGFKNAIQALDQPDDPDWDPGDARYSTIRWMPSLGGTFAIGPSDVDPRSGEILNSDILFTSSWVRSTAGQPSVLADSPLDFITEDSDALRLARILNPDYTEYLCSIGSSAFSAHSNLLRYTLIGDGTIQASEELPEELVGQALRETTMHEVGHGIGLRHNFEASMAVPFESLHDTSYTREYGVTASVMEYNPPNISPDRSEQGDYYNFVVGPYDKWAIQWGYLDVGNEELETHPTLESIAEELSKPGHQFGTDEDAWIYPYALDPHIQQWDLGSDPRKFYRREQEVIKNAWSGLEQRIVAPGGELWPIRNAIHSLLFLHAQGYLYQTKALGGMNVTRAHADDPAGLTPLSVLSANEQREAFEFILEAFSSDIFGSFPKELLQKAVPERHWDNGTSFFPGSSRFNYPIHDIITGLRSVILDMSFWPERMARIRDNAYLTNDLTPFTLGEMYQGFTNAIFDDILAGDAANDSFKRSIQSNYIDRLLVQATGNLPHGSLFGDVPWWEEQVVSTGNVRVQAGGGLSNGYSLGEDSQQMDQVVIIEDNPIALHPNAAAAAPGVNDARALAFAELIRIHDAIEAVLGVGFLNTTDHAHLLEIRHRIESAINL